MPVGASLARLKRKNERAFCGVVPVSATVARWEYIAGLLHSSHMSGSRLSRRHSYSANCEGVKSLTAWKLKSAERLFVVGVVAGAGGTVWPGVRPGASTITVSGGVMPTPLMIRLTGVGSTLSARSTARTSNVNSPSSGSGTDHGLEQPFH